MSVERFLVVLKTARIHEDDRVWFGRWLRRYAVFLHQPETASLTLSPDSVKQFCRTLLGRQVPAWQRLQAVRAIELYRSEVLGTSDPDLLEIRQILGRKAESERVAVTTPQDEAELVGVISTIEPLWIQKMRAELGSTTNAVRNINWFVDRMNLPRPGIHRRALAEIKQTAQRT